MTFTFTINPQEIAFMIMIAPIVILLAYSALSDF